MLAGAVSIGTLSLVRRMSAAEDSFELLLHLEGEYGALE